MANDSLRRAITATLCYFDVFDYPLTAMETWKWLYVEEGNDAGQASMADVERCLAALRQEGKLAERYGWYFFPGRESIVGTRQDRYRWAEMKYHRVKRVARWLALLPFVRMVGICNSLAYSNSRNDSDIDLFIVSRAGRAWQCRFWVTGLLALLRLRPKPGQTRDTVCPSFFVDEQHLRLDGLSLANDIYLTYWVAQVMPLYGYQVYERFWQENAWIAARLPNVLLIDPPRRRRVSGTPRLQAALEFLTAWIPERWFAAVQLKIMPASLRQRANTDTCVVVREGVLKFHDTDRRQQYADAWQERIRLRS